MKGSIEVICGPMFSGKTEELIRRVKRARIAKQDVIIFKPRIDNRYCDHDVASHSGYTERAIPISSVEEGEIAYQNYLSLHGGKHPDIVAIEEVQFFEIDIISKIKELKKAGIKAIVAGLDMDWMGGAFHRTGILMSYADKVDKLKAVCVVCGEDASRSYKKSESGERIEVGEKNLYEARCYKHWRKTKT